MASPFGVTAACRLAFGIVPFAGQEERHAHGVGTYCGVQVGSGDGERRKVVETYWRIMQRLRSFLVSVGVAFNRVDKIKPRSTTYMEVPTALSLCEHFILFCKRSSVGTA